MHENQTYFLNVLKYTPFKFKNSWKYFTFYQILLKLLFSTLNLPIKKLNFHY